jgi:hypothetical protein
MMKKLLVLFIGTVFIVSCNCNRSGGSTEPGFGADDTNAIAGAIPIAEGSMDDLVQNISSPVEMANLIKSLGVPFSVKYLASTKNVSNYNTAYSKAFNIGIFSANLGYLNMYSKTSSVLQYITAIKQLSDGINVGQFFDFSTLKRLATNNENIDSLKYIAMHSFNVMDEYLKKNHRSNLSALMVSGVYVEGLFLVTQIYKEKPNKKLADYIGEQKKIFSELLLILKNYAKDPYFANLVSELETIKKEFESVKITIEKGEPESIEKDGMLTIVQHDRSIIDVSDATMNRIIEQTAIVRNKLIQ